MSGTVSDNNKAEAQRKAAEAQEAREVAEYMLSRMKQNDANLSKTTPSDNLRQPALPKKGPNNKPTVLTSAAEKDRGQNQGPSK